jgi:hypothetical protein
MTTSRRRLSAPQFTMLTPVGQTGPPLARGRVRPECPDLYWSSHGLGRPTCHVARAQAGGSRQTAERGHSEGG